MHTWARRWHLLTAGVALLAVLLQLVLVMSGSAVLAEGEAPSLAARTGRFFCYFTIQANALVAATTLFLVCDPAYDGPRWRVLRGAAIVGITITGLVHFVLLRPLLDLDGLDRLADMLLHLVVPVLAIAGWSIFGPRPRMRLHELGLAFLWPVAWLLVTFAVRAATGWVPYPFLDPDGDAGWAGVAVACVGITVLFALTALAAYAVDRRLAPRPAVPAGR